MRHQLTAASFVFLLGEDGKLLLLRRLSSWRQGMFDVPAGHLEPGETFLQAACREVTEEVGVDVAASDMEPVHILEMPNEGYVYVYFLAKRWSGTPRILEPKSHSELVWASPDEWPSPVDYTKAAWERAHAGERWSVWRDE